MQVAESQIKQFIECLHSLEVGDLKSLEEQLRSTVNTMGCLLMETTLSTCVAGADASQPQRRGLWADDATSGKTRQTSADPDGACHLVASLLSLRRDKGK
jgi:hypothetical protein